MRRLQKQSVSVCEWPTHYPKAFIKMEQIKESEEEIVCFYSYKFETQHCDSDCELRINEHIYIYIYA